MNENAKEPEPLAEESEKQRTETAEPLKALRSPQDIWSPALVGARRGLLFLAWLIALLVGWQAIPIADLLEATVRGALAWLGTWIIGNLGIGLMERILVPTESNDTTLTN
ncbi:hypothetical protein [Armatimonas sp.]|uniref:hypothetical protein n=1 Tax=Armatimonas sp. TaxID=1872638 RepID=UPI00286CCE8A|nr:hypothetical protein [Armatimonas sp.]